MDREEAINIVRKNIPHLGLGATEMTEALGVLIPELRESEDERIRKEIISALKFANDGGVYDKHIAYLEKQEQKPISSCDIVPYIDDKIAALQDMWREEKVAFDWDDMHEMIEDVARHFYQKEPKPRIEICPHSIKSKSYRENGVPTESISDELVDIIKGEFEGFRNLLKKKGIDYEPQRGYWEGFARLFDSSAREYVKEQKPAEWNDTDNIGWDEAFACVTRAEKAAKNEEELQNAVTAEKWLKEIKFKYCVHPVKQEWSEEDEEIMDNIICILQKDVTYTTPTRPNSCTSSGNAFYTHQTEIDWLKSLRPQPHWKPSEEQIQAIIYLASSIPPNFLKEQEYTMRLVDEVISNLKKLCQ